MQLLKACFIGLLIAGLAGCKKAQTPESVEIPKEREVAFSLQVLADTGSVAEARSHWIDRAEKAFAQEYLDAFSGFVDYDLLVQLENNREVLSPRVERIMQNTNGFLPGRLHAALLLWHSKDPRTNTVHRLIEQSLRDLEPAVIKAAASFLAYLPEEQNDDFLIPSMHPTLVALLDHEDEEIRSSANSICLVLQLPEAIGRTVQTPHQNQNKPPPKAPQERRNPDFDPYKALERLQQLNLLTPSLAKRGRKALDEAEPGEREKAYRNVLWKTGLVLEFDTEADRIPVRHDLLLYEFAKVSRGKFQIEAPLEQMLRESPDDWEPPYLVQFIHDGRLYKFLAQNLGDWYDVKALVNAANRALTQAGVLEQFVPLASGGQDTGFILADRELLEELDILGFEQVDRGKR